MPQLGMTQDSGVIVSWLKGTGDPVAEGDALFEVETDKATMEVEAQADGFLAGDQSRRRGRCARGRCDRLIVDNESDVGQYSAAPPVEIKEPDVEEEAKVPASAAPADRTCMDART